MPCCGVAWVLLLVGLESGEPRSRAKVVDRKVLVIGCVISYCNRTGRDGGGLWLDCLLQATVAVMLNAKGPYHHNLSIHR